MDEWKEDCSSKHIIYMWKEKQVAKWVTSLYQKVAVEIYPDPSWLAIHAYKSRRESRVIREHQPAVK